MAQDLKVGIKITADGKQAADELNQISGGLEGVGGKAKDAAGETDLLTTGLKGVAAALTVDFLLNQATELGKLADEYNNMAGRLKLVAGEGDGLATALENVRATANESGAAIGATADLYGVLARATKGSAAEVDALTSIIIKSFAVSGASTAEVEGATRQLGQALASGVLRGDEFNSVMEQAPRLAMAMAAGLNVTTGELRTMAGEGKLTADVVIGAIKSQAAAINTDFATLPDTIGRATQRMANEWQVFIGELDKTSGASAAVASAIDGVSSNLSAVASIATVAGEAVFAAFATKAGGALLTYGKELMAARAATTASAAASIESGNAANWATLQSEKMATAELARAKAVQSATAATLAEVAATSAAAQQAAIYGPQRAALEREVAAARTVNATATKAVVLAEQQLLAAQQAGITAAGALTAATTTNAGLMATAWGKVQGAAHSVMTAIRSIPTSWMVMIAVVGWEAGVAGVKKLSEALAEMALKLDGTRDRLDAQREAMAEQAGVAASTAQALSEYKDVAIQVAANVARMGEAERERYEYNLKQSRAYWEAIYREQSALLELGQGSAQAKEEAGKHLAAIGAGIRDLEAAATLTKEAIANMIDPAAAGLLADFNTRVDELKTKGESAGIAIKKALADMAKELDTGSTDSVLAYGQALDQLGKDGTLSAQQVGDAWAAAIGKLDGQELEKFAITAQTAFGSSERDASALSDVMDQVLRRAIANSGQDFGLLSTGMSSASTNSLASLDLIVGGIDRLKSQGVDTGKAIEGALIAAFKAASNQTEINAVITRMDELGLSGDKAGHAINDAMIAARQKVDDLTPGIQSAEEAYRKLGITSQEALTKQSTNLREAYEYLVKSGASINEQNAAWAKYAEAAIAANGGVASSTLQAEAAQHGMTIAIDNTGKATVRTKEVLESMASASRRAADAATAANTQAMESAAVAASRAQTSIGSLQGSIDDFHARLRGLGNALGSNLDAARSQLFEATNGSIAAMESLKAYTRSNVGWGYSGGISDYIMHVQKGVKSISDLYYQQMEKVKLANSALAADQITLMNNNGIVVSSFANTIAMAEQAAASAGLLGEEDLASLRASIADAENRMLNLREAARSTLDGIQDEWDRLNNNLDEIEQRRADKRIVEIDAQISAAKASGDSVVVRDLEKARGLLIDISSSYIKDAAEKEKAAKKPITPVPMPQTSGSSHTVKIVLPSGVSKTINTASAADAASLSSLLAQLSDTKMRSI